MRNYVEFFFAVYRFHFDNGSFQFDSYQLAFEGTAEEMESNFVQSQQNLQPNFTLTSSGTARGYLLLDKDLILELSATFLNQQVSSSTGLFSSAWASFVQVGESPRKSWSHGH